MTILILGGAKSRGEGTVLRSCGTTILKGVEYSNCRRRKPLGGQTCPECETALAPYSGGATATTTSWDDFENAHVEEDFYDALQHPSPISRSGTLDYVRPLTHRNGGAAGVTRPYAKIDCGRIPRNGSPWTPT